MNCDLWVELIVIHDWLWKTHFPLLQGFYLSGKHGPRTLHQNKNKLIESDIGMEMPANFSATNRLHTREISNYPARVET